MEEVEKGDETRKTKYSIQQGMLKYKNRLAISKSSTLISTILHNYHDSVFGSHSGFLQLAGELYWEGMEQDVKKYC